MPVPSFEIWFTILLYAIFKLAVGIGFLFKPKFFVEMQKKIYAKIKWPAEGNKVNVEIVRTRVIGLLIILFVLMGGLLAVWLYR